MKLGFDYSSLETAVGIFNAGYYKDNTDDDVYIQGNIECVRINGCCICLCDKPEHEIELSINNVKVCSFNHVEENYMWICPDEVEGVDKAKILKTLDIEDYEEIKG